MTALAKTALAKSHQHTGYLLVVLVVIEFFRVLLSDNPDDQSIGSIYGKAVTGLVHLQVLIGIVYFYFLWPNGPHLLHPTGSLIGAVLLQVSTKYSGNTRIGLNLAGTLSIVGAVVLAILTSIRPIA